jgi:hypothetical protein
MLLAKTQESKPTHFSLFLVVLSFPPKKTAASATHSGRHGAIHKVIERSKRRKKKKKRTSFFCALAVASAWMYVCCCQQQQQQQSRNRRKRREKEREEKKSYFIKNGIEPLLPSCHPSVYGLYKLTGQAQTSVLRRIIRLQTSSKRRTQTKRYRQVRKKTFRCYCLHLYIYYLYMFLFFVDMYSFFIVNE